MAHQQNIADKLMNYGIMINNAISDTEIANALASFGYTTEKLNAAKGLLSESEALVNEQIREYGEQYEATEKVMELWEGTGLVYTNSLKIARIAFKDNTGAQAALLLNGRRKKTLGGWLQQALAFYKNLEGNTAFMEAMAKFGYTAEKVEAEKALVGELEAAKHEQAREKGEAQQATIDRDEKLDALDEWISEFRVIARIALEDHPQWLEKLGIIEPS